MTLSAGPGSPLLNSLLKPRRTAARTGLSLEEAHRRAAALDLGAPVSIRVNARARRLLLRIDASDRTVELVLPHRVPPEQGLRFLEAQRGWIASRLDALPEPKPFVDGAVVPVFGVPHRICHETDRAAPPVAIVNGEIRVRGEPEHIARRVHDFLVRLARQELSRRARVYAAQVGRPVAKVSVRDTKSRWGSCSSAGALSFSWRLVFAPEAVVDYVVAHEVAHLVEMNHSPHFWKLLRTMTPDCATPRAWLKRYRTELLSYG